MSTMGSELLSILSVRTAVANVGIPRFPFAVVAFFPGNGEL